MSRFETLKGRRAALFVILALGLCVFSPAIRAPLFLDDYLHAAMVDGTFTGKRGPADLYDFVNDANRDALAAKGLLPWWSHPGLTIRFFRPLSSALLWLEHRVFAHESLPMHLCSFAWWVAATLAVRALYMRFFSGRVVVLGTAIFALAPCHALPLAWLANHETLVTLTFGVIGLSFHLRYRLGKGTPLHAALSAIFFGLSLLGGGEYALAFFGYVLAVELRSRPGASWGARALDAMRGVMPFALPAAAYLAVRFKLHYRTVGSGFYADPLHAPLSFLRTAPDRLVALLADSWLTMGSHTWLPGYPRWALAAIVTASGAALVVPVRRAFASLGDESRLVARTLLVGSVLALVPTLAVVPAFRLLGVSTIGVAAVCALVMDHAWFPNAPEGSTANARAAAHASFVAVLLGFSQLVHGPMTAFLAARAHRHDGDNFAKRAAWTKAHLGNPSQADVGIVRGLAGSFFTPFALDAHGRSPRRWRVLSHCGHVLVLRTDPRTIELVLAQNRSVYPIGEQNLYRDRGSPLRAGDVIRAAGMTVTILEIGEIGPRRVRFTFNEPVEATSWLADTFDATVPAVLPEPGYGTPFDP